MLKNLIEVPVINGTIPFEVSAKYQAAQVILKPAKKVKVLLLVVPSGIF